MTSILTSFVAALPLLGAQAPTQAASAPPSSGADRREAMRQEAASRIESTYLPPALSGDEIDRITQRRWRDPASHDAIAAAKDRYLTVTREQQMRLREPLRARLDAAYAWSAATARMEPRAGPELVAFHRERLAWIAALDAAEAELLRFLGAIPPSADGDSLPRLRVAFAGERDRRPISDPLAALALEDLLSSMPEPEIQALVKGEELDAWRDRMAAALRARREALDRLLLRRAEALEARGPFDLLPDDPRLATFEREIAEIEASESSTEAPIAELNRVTLARLLAQLPPAAAEALAERIARIVQPQVFDEERSLAALMARLASDAALDPATADTLRGLAAHGEQRLASTRAPLLRRLEARDQAERLMLVDPTPASKRRLLTAEAQLIEAELARRRVVRQVLDAARGVVPAQLATASQLIKHHLDRLAALDRVDQWRLALAIAELASLDQPPAPLATNPLPVDSPAPSP